MPDTNIFDLTQIYNFAVSAGEIGIFHYFNNCYFQITNNRANAHRNVLGAVLSY